MVWSAAGCGLGSGGACCFANIAFKPATLAASIWSITKPLSAAHCSNSIVATSNSCSPASAATRANVSSSAPNATKLTSPSTDLRAMYTGPVNSRPLAEAVLPSVMNTTFSAVAPIDDCHGNPFSLVAMISWAVTPVPEITPFTSSDCSPTAISSV